ncbi:MAG: HslU--HslV peptidase ATPase subunit, partial [Eubacteriaceae bacterium]|nr:HslU--HslV peptidase ATPase subunit [Eubacteriaceae bacterium]
MKMKDLTPKIIVNELDRYIIGQDKAKKAVAVSLRNRYRRSLLPEEIRDEITPKNIILMGPTGVGKTEIARRIAKLVSAPFIKVEATKFTEVGYVGRDVESMVRDLVTTSIRMVQQQKMKEVYAEAQSRANQMILDVLGHFHKVKKNEKLVNPFDILSKSSQQVSSQNELSSEEKEIQEKQLEKQKIKRNEIEQDLIDGKLENEIIEIEVEDDPGKSIGIMAGMSEDMSIEIGNIFDGIMPNKKKKKRSMKVSDARKVITNQEAQKMIDMDEVHEVGLREAEQNGIIFIDEIDKIIGNNNGSNGPDVSREGVQRDILPIVEGSTINTKYGP